MDVKEEPKITFPFHPSLVLYCPPCQLCWLPWEHANTGCSCHTAYKIIVKVYSYRTPSERMYCNFTRCPCFNYCLFQFLASNSVPRPAKLSVTCNIFRTENGKEWGLGMRLTSYSFVAMVTCVLQCVLCGCGLVGYVCSDVFNCVCVCGRLHHRE